MPPRARGLAPPRHAALLAAALVALTWCSAANSAAPHTRGCVSGNGHSSSNTEADGLPSYATRSLLQPGKSSDGSGSPNLEATQTGGAGAGSGGAPANPGPAGAIGHGRPGFLRHRKARARSHQGHCVGSIGSWCAAHQPQLPLAPFKAPPILGKPCPGNCSGVGNCHGDTGTCDCPAGVWAGQ